MTNFRAVLVAVVALGIGPLAGCARADNGTAPADIATSRPAGAVALRVSFVGGLVDPATSVAQVPPIAVYGDGRVISEGTVPAYYPGPALPNVQVQRITPADVTRLVRLALDAGVGAGTDLGVPQIVDAPMTRFEVQTDTGLRTTEAAALTEGQEGASGLTPAQRDARAKLVHLRDQLTDLPKVLGHAVDEAKPFEPAGMMAVVSEFGAGGQPTEPLPQPAEVAWPGPALPGEPLAGVPGLTCVTTTGDGMAKLLGAARKAHRATRWVSGGKQWSVAFRPVLPDESGCADLRAR
jgi:hypothetical protein